MAARAKHRSTPKPLETYKKPAAAPNRDTSRVDTTKTDNTSLHQIKDKEKIVFLIFKRIHVAKMTGGDGFYDETEVGPTLADLDKQRSIPKSKYHNSQYVKEEEEILEFYKGWIHCLNNEFNKSIDPGRKFYNFDDCMTYDIYGYTGRGVFKPHYDNTFHYFSDSHCDMKDLEIFATSPTTGYALLVQRLKGKTDRGEPFQMTYRMTQIVQKVEGKWQWIHEHVSFPCDMRTMKADSTCSVDPLEAFQFKELENGSKK